MRKRLLIATGITLLVFVAYMLCQWFWPSSRIIVSRETTFITEPIADDGLPDYAKYLLDPMREGVTPENNGGIPFLEAMWPAELEPRFQQALCTELGFAMPKSDGLSEPDSNRELEDMLVEWLSPKYPEAYRGELIGYGDDLVKYAMNNPWKTSDIPPLADWLDAHQADFELLHEAADSERFYVPSPSLLTNPNASLVFMDISHVHALKSAIRCLQTRANLRIGTGELEAAWQDCRAMYALSDKLRGIAINYELTSVAGESLANKTTLEILQDDQLSAGLAEEIQDFFASRPLRNSMRQCLNVMERLMLITSLLEMSGQRHIDQTERETRQQIPVDSSLPIDWGVILKAANKFYDDIDAALAKPTVDEWQEGLAGVYAILNEYPAKAESDRIGSALSRRIRNNHFANVVAADFIPPIGEVMWVEIRTNQWHSPLRISADLALFRTVHGAYPDSLAELPPAKHSRVDLYDKPLVYRRTIDGYVLYSLGGDGTDQGGSNSEFSIYKGYPVAETVEDDQDLRRRLGEPPFLPETEDDYYQPLTPPENADDIAIRLPLLPRPLPTFEPSKDE